jgi:hypothetical protein
MSASCAGLLAQRPAGHAFGMGPYLAAARGIQLPPASTSIPRIDIFQRKKTTQIHLLLTFFLSPSDIHRNA